MISVPAVLTSYNTDYAKATGDTLTFFPGNSTINLNYKYNKTTSSSIGWLNYIELNVRRNLNLSTSQMLIRDINSVGNGNITQFSLSNAGSNVKIWEDIYSRRLGRQRAVLTGRKTRKARSHVSYSESGLNPSYVVGDST